MKPVFPALVLAAACVSGAAMAAPPIERLKLPPGFKIEVYADKVGNARSLALGDKGTVFVGTRSDSALTADTYRVHAVGREAERPKEAGR